eukprot:TRINITY_DN625_c1_g1_i1.p1 TRINITY_DN625_c1_g1~~TRINITY_DN625_c1_g1_i1.p1  ORF type:complete len:975 (+),score=327.07 TRINITY_DN625_c1_g1_i1:85-3009(+)
MAPKKRPLSGTAVKKASMKMVMKAAMKKAPAAMKKAPMKKVMKAAMKNAPMKKAEDWGKSYYKVIKGVKYDRKLLNTAMKYKKSGGEITAAEAEKLVKEAADDGLTVTKAGPGITPTERRTLKHILKTFPMADGAEDAMKTALGLGKPSYYKVIDGQKYDRELLEYADNLANKGKDGKLSPKDVEELTSSAANDGPGMTPIERKTLQRILETVSITTSAASKLKRAVAKRGQSYYKVIDGAKYDRELLDAAEDMAADGQISEQEMKDLWAQAEDGPGITPTEKRTLEHIRDTMKLTPNAQTFINSVMKNKPTSYYKQIDGVKYDRELLEHADEFAADGQISDKDIKELWAEAEDGPGITDTERRTLEYIRSSGQYKLTKKAQDFLNKVMKKRHTSYYKQVDGVKYDRELYELAEKMAQDGQLSADQVKEFWTQDEDGPGITPTELRTLKQIQDKYKLPDEAKCFLDDVMAKTKPAEDKPDLEAEEKAKAEQAMKDAAEQARKEKDAAEQAAKEAEAKAAAEKELAIKEAEAKAEADRLANEAAEKAAAEEDGEKKAAAEQAAQEAAQKATEAAEREEAAKKAAEKAARVEADKKADLMRQAQMAAFEKAQREKAEKERLAKLKTAAEKAELAKKAADSSQVIEDSEKLGAELEAKFGSLFDKIDTSSDGKLSAQALKDWVSKNEAAAAAAASMELGIGKIDDFVKEAATDGDGEVDRDDFLGYFAHVNTDKDKCFNALFDAIDVNGDGVLTFQEVRDYQWHKNTKFFQLLGIYGWHSMVAQMDTNNDGKIDRKEFVDYLKNKQKAGDAGQQAFPDAKSTPAWKQARAMPTPGTGKGGDKGGGKGGAKVGKSDPNRCWDFDGGYCYRGARCCYKHYKTTQQDQATLDAHHKQCSNICKQAGINLSQEAHNELQTLKVVDAQNLICSLGAGGQNEGVLDKNHFVIHSARRLRAQAGVSAHPDWEWYHGRNKRARKC